MTTKLAAILAAAGFAAFASLGHAAESVNSRTTDGASNVQGRAAALAVPGKSISVRAISGASDVQGRSSLIGNAGIAQVSAVLDLERFGRA
jgi:hypothetical protein